MLIDKTIDTNARDEMINFINKWRLDSYLETPSEWAEKNRYLPQGTTARPGKIDHSIAPHMREICDLAHPDSGISQISIMKSTQSLATTTVEHVIGWAIDHGLHNILYITSSLSMAKQRSSAAIDVLIDYSGLSDKVKPISTRMKRKTADNTFWKEFSMGYRMMLTSWNSIADAKSFSWNMIIMDEIDEAPHQLGGQGDTEALFSVRGITERGLKIFKLSTPTTTHGRIFKNFMDGDRRYYNCQCPLCGELQPLKIMYGGLDHGLFGRVDDTGGMVKVIPDTVRYTCEFCKGEIYEYQKQDMLTGGKWIPTAAAINPAYASFHISNLMSPIAFFSWTQVLQQYAETDFGQKVTKYKTFKINIEGLPWETITEKKEWTVLKQKAEPYKLHEIPSGGLIVTGGADVQKNRIELQVVCWGANMESWVIDYQIFMGDTYDIRSTAWQGISQYLQTKKYKMGNRMLPISMTAIDSGYNPKSEEKETSIRAEHIVYEFVAQNHIRCVAVRGNPDLKDTVLKEERVKRESPLKRRYDIAVNELKDEIFVKIDLPPGASGYMHFSQDLSDEYFRGFMSEVYMEVEPGKWRWDKITSDIRNEPLDTWIYARGAAERLNLPTWTEDVWDKYKSDISM